MSHPRDPITAPTTHLALAAALTAIGFHGVAVTADGQRWTVTIATPPDNRLAFSNDTGVWALSDEQNPLTVGDHSPLDTGGHPVPADAPAAVVADAILRVYG